MLFSLPDIHCVALILFSIFQLKIMKKLINDPLKVADELLEGLVEAYDGQCVKIGTRSIVKREIPEGK